MAPWSAQRQRAAMEWYALSRGVTVYMDVPVTQPGWRGWPDETNRRLEVIAVGHDGVGEGRLVPFDEERFELAISEPEPLRPLIARGYADRTVFGWLLTRQAFVARSWRPHGPVLPVAIVGSGGERTNVAPAYLAHGFEIIAMPGLDIPTPPDHEDGP